MKRLGVIGTMVWDTIHGRGHKSSPVEEWGGIAYALSALAAHLPPGWEIVPLVKVGRDLAPRATTFLRSLERFSSKARFVEVPDPNRRVVLHYRDGVRYTEAITGGAAPWTWEQLGPMVTDLDAVYVNFIEGLELDLATAQALRRGFGGPLYADLHSLYVEEGTGPAKVAPTDAVAWFRCFEVVQINEEEMLRMTTDPLTLAATALGDRTRLIVVTLGERGAIYVEATGDHQPVRTALIAAEDVHEGDATGCGDVFGATLVTRLLTATPTEHAIGEAHRASARNVLYHGTAGLYRHLRGELASA